MKSPVVLSLLELTDVHDNLRKPISQTERNKREGHYPYYGATGQVGWIDDYRQEGKYILLGEDGAPFLDPHKSKAYIVEGKCWVNNHAHVLKVKDEICDIDFLCFALNWVDYSGIVTGSTRLKLAQSSMHKILIPTPSLSEQKAIARTLAEELEEIEKSSSVIRQQILDLDLLSKNQKERAQSLLSNVSHVPLGDLLHTIEAGKSLKTLELPARPNQLAILKVSAVSWKTFKPQEAKIIDSDYKPDERHRVKKGDLIISRANTLELVGAVVLVQEDYPERLLSDKTLRLVVDAERVLPEYLLHVLRLSKTREHIENNATGSNDSMRNISQKTIRNTPIPLPGKAFQQEVIDLLTQTDIATNEAKQALTSMLADLNVLPSKLFLQAFGAQQ